MRLRVPHPSDLRPKQDAVLAAAHGGNEPCKEQFIETEIVDGPSLVSVAHAAREQAIKSFKYMYLVRTPVSTAIAAIGGLIVHDEGMNKVGTVL
jgi:hypothetical protein